MQPDQAPRRSRALPVNQTGHEQQYLKHLSEKKCTVQLKLRGGECVRGTIEYFDNNMLRLTREGKPNLFIYKHQILTLSDISKRRVVSGREAQP